MWGEYTTRRHHPSIFILRRSRSFVSVHSTSHKLDDARIELPLPRLAPVRNQGYRLQQPQRSRNTTLSPLLGLEVHLTSSGTLIIQSKTTVTTLLVSVESGRGGESRVTLFSPFYPLDCKELRRRAVVLYQIEPNKNL